MPPLPKRALAIALLPTVLVSFLIQACLGSNATAGSAPMAANKALEGDFKVTSTSTGAVTEPATPGNLESLADLPPSFLAP